MSFDINLADRYREGAFIIETLAFIFYWQAYNPECPIHGYIDFVE